MYNGMVKEVTVNEDFLKRYRAWREQMLAENPDATDDELSEDAYIDTLLD